MELAERVLDGGEVTEKEALSILECPDDDVLLLMHAAFQIRKRYYGKKSKAQYDYECKIRPLSGKLRLLLAVFDIKSADRQLPDGRQNDLA